MQLAIYPTHSRIKGEYQQQRRCETEPDQQLAGRRKSGVAIVHPIDIVAHGDWTRFAYLN
jgi:hypothetical protein